MSDLNLIGFYLEEDGHTVVLVDASGSEHEATSPEELWVAMMTVASDPSLPRCEQEQQDYAEAAGGGDAYSFACDQAEGILSDVAGPILGRAAGRLIRNHGQEAVGFVKRFHRRKRR